MTYNNKKVFSEIMFNNKELKNEGPWEHWALRIC